MRKKFLVLSVPSSPAVFRPWAKRENPNRMKVKKSLTPIPAPAINMATGLRHAVFFPGMSFDFFRRLLAPIIFQRNEKKNALRYFIMITPSVPWTQWTLGRLAIQVRTVFSAHRKDTSQGPGKQNKSRGFFRRREVGTIPNERNGQQRQHPRGEQKHTQTFGQGF